MMQNDSSFLPRRPGGRVAMVEILDLIYSVFFLIFLPKDPPRIPLSIRIV